MVFFLTMFVIGSVIGSVIVLFLSVLSWAGIKPATRFLEDVKRRAKKYDR